MEGATFCERVVPSLLVSDMGETLAYYRKLGFEVTGCDGAATSSTWAEVSRGQITFQFYSEPPHGTPTTPICSATFNVFTSEVDALAEEFRTTVEFAWGPETMDYGMKEFAVRDPNGYLITFAEPACR